MTRASAPTRADLALLLLRSAGLVLLLTFGAMKFFGLLRRLHAGGSLADSGLAQMIQSVGVPFSGAAYAFVALSESVAAAFIAFGLLTRFFATCAALSMIGALYFSLRTHEEPLRAALHLTMFLAIVLLGPGKFSIDRLFGIDGKN